MRIYSFLRQSWKILLLISAVTFASALFFLVIQCQGCEQRRDWYPETYYETFLKEYVGSEKIVREFSPVNDEDKHIDPVETTRLPIVNITIDEKHYEKLIDATPMFDLEKNSPVNLPYQKWAWSKAKFSLDGSPEYIADVRFRGWFYDHYRFPKKSWRIKLKRKKLINGQKYFNVVNPRPKAIINDTMSYEVLRKSGFMMSQQRLVHTRINGEYAGIQFYFEHPDGKLLTRYNSPIGQIYGEESGFFSFAAMRNLDNWEIHSGEKSYAPLNSLFDALANKGKPEFKKQIDEILDVNNYLHYLVDAAIGKRLNPSSHNNRFYFDNIKGKFQIWPWYQLTGPHATETDSEPVNRGPYFILNDIAHGLLQVPEYFDAYQKLIWGAINTTHHPDVLVNLHNQIFETTKADVFADGHINSFSKTKYKTNKELMEWHENSLKNIPAYSLNIRKELVASNLKFDWRKDGDRILLELTTDKLSAPIVKSICFDTSGRYDGVNFTLISLEGGEHFQKDYKLAGPTRCLNTDIKIRPNHEYVETPPGQLTTSGITISGYNAITEVNIKAVPTTFIFELKSDDVEFVSSVKSVNISAINSITKGPVNTSPDEAFKKSLSIPVDNKYFHNFSPKINPNDRFEPSRGLNTWVMPYDDEPQNIVTWEKGSTIYVEQDLVFDTNTHLIIEPGSKVSIAPGKSIMVKGRISAIGSKASPIEFGSSDANEPFGAIIIANTRDRKNIFKNVVIENGSDKKIGHVSYLAALSVYASTALIENVTFINNKGGDALNAVYSKTRVVNSIFKNNSDCVDFDFSAGEIIDSTFENCADDGIDVSHSNTLIEGNRIVSTFDKGISVGEKSQPIIRNNYIEDATTGIAVKDLSTPFIADNTILKTETGISLYVKKNEFGPPVVCISGNTLLKNGRNTVAADLSKIVSPGTDAVAENRGYCGE